MPNFVINAMVHNNGAATVSAHVGASLVCKNWSRILQYSR